MKTHLAVFVLEWEVSCRESENTHFMFSNSSLKTVMRCVMKYGTARQAT